MPIKITDHTKEAQRRYDRAATLGLRASADRLVWLLKQAHGNDYYKGGAFRTGQVRRSIRRSKVYNAPNGGIEVQVGTSLLFPLFWELGHMNTYTRKYERVRIWEPTALDAVPEMRQVFARVVKEAMDAP